MKLTKRQLDELYRIWREEDEEEPEEWAPTAEEMIAASPTGTLKGVSL